MTLREEEIDKLKDIEKQKTKCIQEKDSVAGDLERKIKHMEKKYEKTIQKLNHELSKNKKTCNDNPDPYDVNTLKSS